MKILDKVISRNELQTLAADKFGDLVKAVVDIDLELDRNSQQEQREIEEEGVT